MHIFCWGVSATSPPIRTYKFSASKKQFESDLASLAKSDSNMVYKITDTVGTAESGFAMYMIIENKGKMYEMQYEEKDDFTLIKLFGVHSDNNTKGGYQIGANGVDKLLVNYENDVIEKLKQRSNVKITLMPKEFSLY